MLYVLQPKIDSKGECYSRALQHLLTGVYLSELCLIGLFGARKAPGPSTLMILLLIATILYHSMINHILTSVKAKLAVNEEGETVPLLAAEEGDAGHSGGHASKSGSDDVGLSRFPRFVADPIAKIVRSYISSTQTTVKSWLNDPSTREDESEVQYTEDQMRKAYLNPALTSETPKLWLVRDEMGISKHEMEENEAVGISTTDEGAFLDPRNRVRLEEHDFSRIPIFKKPVKY
jgi:calcium permeable stress-gated cation channel